METKLVCRVCTCLFVPPPPCTSAQVHVLCVCEHICVQLWARMGGAHDAVRENELPEARQGVGCAGLVTRHGRGTPLGGLEEGRNVSVHFCAPVASGSSSARLHAAFALQKARRFRERSPSDQARLRERQAIAHSRGFQSTKAMVAAYAAANAGSCAAGLPRRSRMFSWVGLSACLFVCLFVCLFYCFTAHAKSA